MPDLRCDFRLLRYRDDLGPISRVTIKGQKALSPRQDTFLIHRLPPWSFRNAGTRSRNNSGKECRANELKTTNSQCAFPMRKALKNNDSFQAKPCRIQLAGYEYGKNMSWKWTRTPGLSRGRIRRRIKATSLPILATCDESTKSTSFASSCSKIDNGTSCTGCATMLTTDLSSGKSRDKRRSGPGSINVRAAVACVWPSVSSITADENPEPTSMILRGFSLRIMPERANASANGNIPLSVKYRYPSARRVGNGRTGNRSTRSW